MERREYAQKVAELIGGRIVEKGNGFWERQGPGVTTNQGDGLSKIWYMRQFMKEGWSPEQTADFIKKDEEKEDMSGFDAEQITDREKVLQNLRVKLMHVDNRPQVFRSAADYGFEDLVIVPYVEITMPDGTNASTTVGLPLLEAWDMSPKECIDRAMENSRKDVKIEDFGTIGRRAAEMIGAELPEIENPPLMMVVSNSKKYMGASAVLFADEELKRIFKTGYTVIPSSRHEVIAVDRADDAEGGMNRMVREVNMSELDERDRLSDHVYSIW